MSFVDLLFPQEQLEALGNKWHEPAPKRRKLECESGKAVAVKGALGPQRKQASEAALKQRRHRLSTPAAYEYGTAPSSSENTNARSIKRSNSDSETVKASITRTSTADKKTAISKSCLPSFIEPSILKNYLRHLHPKDSHRYTVPNSHHTDSHGYDEAVSSPGSLIADSSSSPASTDSCSTPAAICELFRSGPFGNLCDGLRLTDNERDMMEDLLSPDTTILQDEVPGQKRKLPDVQVKMAPENYYDVDESLLRSMFSESEDKGRRGLGPYLRCLNNSGNEFEVHSSGLSPVTVEAEEEENVTSHRGIVVYDYDALSVDDFFDLDEAST